MKEYFEQAEYKFKVMKKKYKQSKETAQEN